jgi:hypothetical protein
MSLVGSEIFTTAAPTGGLGGNFWYAPFDCTAVVEIQAGNALGYIRGHHRDGDQRSGEVGGVIVGKVAHNELVGVLPALAFAATIVTSGAGYALSDSGDDPFVMRRVKVRGLRMGDALTCSGVMYAVYAVPVDIDWEVIDRVLSVP